MDSAMSLTSSKRKATTQDVGSSSNESCKRREIRSTNDDDQSSYPPTSLSRNWDHQVFPSFRGEDVRKTILSHLLASFERKTIYPFIDNEIDRGNSIGPELIKAIQSSKIAIVLLSKNYASSSWCLNELAEIMECKEKRGQIVIPIFYEVDPSNIRKQAGDFGKAFKKTCEGKTKKDIEKWKNALTDVATIAGEDSAEWSNEAAMIEKITTDVVNKLTNSTPSKELDDYVGMRAHMEGMLSLLRLDLDEVRMIGIWGPPGIGKSTIARVVFNQLSSSFQHKAITVEIKESYRRPGLNVQLQLQKKMLLQVMKQKDIEISHLEVAPALLKDKKVLLVIDEVDHKGQLDALAGKKSWFGSGSRIIVTSEDRSLLKAHDINHIYQVYCPVPVEEFQIFCMHAFGKKYPPDDGFYKLAKEVYCLAGRLPLGLKVLGSALEGKSQQDWKDILPSLVTSFDGEIESIIKFSYDALRDDDKYLFLYLSCFFTGELADKVVGLLLGQFPYVKARLNILKEKSLIFIRDGRIHMHKPVRQFGIETSRKHLTKCVFDERDICEMLTEETTDSRRLIGIHVNWKTIEERLKIEENVDIIISDKILKKMADLQLIRVCDYHISPCESEDSELRSLIFHSRKIRSFSWLYFRNTCLPSTFHTDFLVNLDLAWSKLEKLWEGHKVLQNLKWMELSHSRHLKELPDLSTATKLEKLILSDCKSLEELPDLPTTTKLRILDLECCSSLVKFSSSFANFNNLDHINLHGCKCLVELPFYIGTATNLQRLDFERCSSLVKLPSSIGNLFNLEEIYLKYCSSLMEIPLSIGKLLNLKMLDMDRCSKLEALPTNINLESLEVLILLNCSQLKSFPEISTNIFYLDLRGTAINDIPLAIMLWPHLSYLHLKNCNNLVSLPQFPDSLRLLNARNCKSLERLDCSFNNPGIELLFSNCFKLNQEARDLIINTSCKYAVLPGTEMPACFNYGRGTGGGLVTIKLNESTHPTSLRFKVCITLVKGDEETSHGEDESSDNEDENSDVEDEDERGDVWVISMMVKQKDHIFPCRPSSPEIHKRLREHIYIFEVAFEVEAEEVTSTELVLELKTKSPGMLKSKTSRMWKIGEWGLMKI